MWRRGEVGGRRTPRVPRSPTPLLVRISDHLKRPLLRYFASRWQWFHIFCLSEAIKRFGGGGGNQRSPIGTKVKWPRVSHLFHTALPRVSNETHHEKIHKVQSVQRLHFQRQDCIFFFYQIWKLDGLPQSQKQNGVGFLTYRYSISKSTILQLTNDACFIKSNWQKLKSIWFEMCYIVILTIEAVLTWC